MSRGLGECQYNQGPLKAAFGHSTTKVNNDYAVGETTGLDAAGNLDTGTASVVGFVSGISSAAMIKGSLGTNGTLAAGDAVTTSAKNTANYLAASYDFGAYQLMGTYATHKADFAASLNGTEQAGQQAKTKLYQIGVKAPMGAFTPFLTYGNGDTKLSKSGADVASSDVKAYSFGSTYALSKRTSLVAAYTKQITDARVEPVTAGALEQKTKITQTLVGLRHQF